MIAEAVARIRQHHKILVDPRRRGPVPLQRFFEEMNLSHIALPALSCEIVTNHLKSQGMLIESVGEPTDRLAGCLYWSGGDGWAFVNADDNLPRRRFTAAHELGHAVLHRDKMGQFIPDATISETDEQSAEIEREANRFAAELLMPREICEVRAAELLHEHKSCPRIVLAYRLASELLVSREAMRYRLKHLRIGDE